MKQFTLKTEQKLGIEIIEAWDFFRDPVNLKEITPKHLGFEITSKDLPKKIYEGLRISYVVKPILGLPINWLTEISEVKKPFCFVDEQLKGPYSKWHHRHTFEKIKGGTLIQDEVTYALPLGPLGHFMHTLYVRKELEKIFNHRFEYLAKRFPYKQETEKVA